MRCVPVSQIAVKKYIFDTLSIEELIPPVSQYHHNGTHSSHVRDDARSIERPRGQSTYDINGIGSVSQVVSKLAVFGRVSRLLTKKKKGC